MCATHLSKEVQAFCEDEKRLLCVTCLIEQKERHKDHGVKSIADAAASERIKLTHASS